MQATAPRASRSGNFELWSWLFMRVSGMVLIVMVLVHLAIMHVSRPISEVTFSFVAERWDIPAWRWYDLVLLWLALVHGLNGTRVVVDDLIHRRGQRLVVMSTLWVLAFVFLVVGSQVILSFQAASMP